MATYRLIPKPNCPVDAVRLGSLLPDPEPLSAPFYILGDRDYEEKETDPVKFSIDIKLNLEGKIGVNSSLASVLSLGGGLWGAWKREEGRYLSCQKMVGSYLEVTEDLLRDLSTKSFVVNHFNDTNTNTAWLISGIKLGWGVIVTDSKLTQHELEGQLNVGGAGDGTIKFQSGRDVRVFYHSEGPVVCGYELTKLRANRVGEMGATTNRGYFYSDNEGDEPSIELFIDSSLTEGATEGYDEVSDKSCQLIVPK
ncbi:hypothetical protein GGS24DRAFT_380225 [Hypoxylon argillaceum]|nr:hypothetical protein GGS24DRAFT_380225 [Hypoxylon argillaceum]KAI1150715.1 hypothetical protein F4825DRAFT_477770 [Nemania diffusa]